MGDKNDIKVSVVVVTYNQAETISRTLDSILEQEVDFNYEIIIGDDASTDSTGLICKEYEKKFPDIIRYIRNEKNKGLIDNYFDCLLSARGTYIADVAGDDFWIYRKKLQEQVNILDEDEGISLVCTDWKVYDENSKELSAPWKEGTYPYRDLFNEKDMTLRLLSHNSPAPVHLCSSMYRKDAFLKLYNSDPFVFRNKQFMVEDLQLIVLLSTVGKFSFLDIPTLAYSVHTGSISGTKDYRKVFDLYYGSLNLTCYLADYLGYKNEDLQSVYKKLSHYILMQAFHAKDTERMNKVKDLIKERKFKIKPRTKIFSLLSANKMTWRLSRSLWQKLRKS